MTNLEYTYDELINKSDEISSFSGNFKKEMDYLSNVVQKISANLQSEEAANVYESLRTIQEKEEDIQSAIDDFALNIREEIAPTYKAIEDKLEEEATSYYG